MSLATFLASPTVLPPMTMTMMHCDGDNDSDEKNGFGSIEDLQNELQELQRQLQQHSTLFVDDGGSTEAEQRLRHQEEQEETLKTVSITPSPPPPPKSANKKYKKENAILRRQLVEEREHVRRLRAMASVTEQHMTQRITALEDRVKILAKRENELQKRRVSDQRGWSAEFSSLRQHLSALERRQRRLAVHLHLPESDHRDAVLTRLGGTRVTSMDEVTLGTCLADLSEELMALKNALGAFEHQLQ